jgi:mRNA-degrading endonuclease RelE of RelBE toxin-antitoxin system
MPTTVSIPDPFQKELKRLSRKYPQVLDAVETLISTLESDQRPGDKIPHVGYDVYKVRLRNPSAGRGKSGGFRVIYFVQLADSVVLLTIYSKTAQTDISPEEIRRVLQEILPPDTEKDNG